MSLYAVFEFCGACALWRNMSKHIVKIFCTVAYRSFQNCSKATLERTKCDVSTLRRCFTAAHISRLSSNYSKTTLERAKYNVSTSQRCFTTAHISRSSQNSSKATLKRTKCDVFTLQHCFTAAHICRSSQNCSKARDCVAEGLRCGGFDIVNDQHV